MKDITPIKTYEDYLSTASGDKAYDIARAGKWKENGKFTAEDIAKLYKMESKYEEDTTNK